MVSTSDIVFFFFFALLQKTAFQGKVNQIERISNKKGVKNIFDIILKVRLLRWNW